MTINHSISIGHVPARGMGWKLSIWLSSDSDLVRGKWAQVLETWHPTDPEIGTPLSVRGVWVLIDSTGHHWALEQLRGAAPLTDEITIFVLVSGNDRVSLAEVLHCGAADAALLSSPKEEILARIGKLVERSGFRSLTPTRRSGSFPALSAGASMPPLTPTEARLVEFLHCHLGEWIESSYLLQSVLASQLRFDNSLLRVHMFRIRRKLAGSSWVIESRPSFGWRLQISAASQKE